MEKVILERNIIETVLMRIKDLIKHNKKPFYAGFAVLIIILVCVISGAFYYSYQVRKSIEKYEAIMTTYEEDMKDEAKKTSAPEKTAGAVVKLADSVYFGYVNTNGYLIAAGILFQDKKYDKAKDLYYKFAESNSSSSFAVPAFQQSAVCYEWLNDNKKALEIYLMLEKEYSDSQYKDRIIYDIGRMYQKNGDMLKAKEYFNVLLKDFPISSFSADAKKRLFFVNSEPLK